MFLSVIGVDIRLPLAMRTGGDNMYRIGKYLLEYLYCIVFLSLIITVMAGLSVFVILPLTKLMGFVYTLVASVGTIIIVYLIFEKCLYRGRGF